MTFNEAQKKELGAPLSKANVKSRKQSGRAVSYIEGWHAIAEANRIFGFDGWSREMVDLRCVSERDRTIGESKAPGFGVTYTAHVRIRVGDIVREGCGSGHGIDRDCGQAHESALKEAETDAMKRALMTFGNAFGLALYDKEQANVCADEPAKRAPVDVENTIGEVLTFMAQIDQHDTVKALQSFGEKIALDVSKLPTVDQSKVRAHFGTRLRALKAAEILAA